MTAGRWEWVDLSAVVADRVVGDGAAEVAVAVAAATAAEGTGPTAIVVGRDARWPVESGSAEVARARIAAGEPAN